MKFKNYILIVTFIAFNIVAFGQDAIPQSFSDVVSVDSLGKDKLYDNAKTWILTKFMTADNLVQFDDKEHNSIFVTGHIIMEKKKYIWKGWAGSTDNNTLTFKLELNFKDNKFKYEIKNILYSYNRNAGSMTGHEEAPLDKIKDMPQKKIPEVQQEALAKLKAIIEEMKTAVTATKNKNDW